MGPTEIIVILFVLLVLFGSKKLQEMARGFGEATKDLKQAKNEITSAISETEQELKKTVKATNVKNKNDKHA